jgi:phosphoglycolate phosphatase-like HAD superfamily hydrolase
MVGDSYVDVLAGAAAHLKTVFLGKYKCDACQLLGESKPDFIVKNLRGFAEILKGN